MKCLNCGGEVRKEHKSVCPFCGSEQTEETQETERASRAPEGVAFILGMTEEQLDTAIQEYEEDRKAKRGPRVLLNKVALFFSKIDIQAG